jgi:hypothetical protein
MPAKVLVTTLFIGVGVVAASAQTTLPPWPAPGVTIAPAISDAITVATRTEWYD